MSTPPLPELRAKRTHARRSCDVCKIRKTRCELPDLEVVSSSTPLPLDKSCHRCRILSLPCVVDDSNRKIRRKGTGNTEDDASTSSPRPARKRKSAAGLGDMTLHALASSSSGQQQGGTTTTLANIDHTLDILHGLNPTQGQSGFDTDLSALFSSNELLAAGETGQDGMGSGMGGREPPENYQSKSMKLHGRPLELVCAMLSVAYGKRGPRRPGAEDGVEVEVDLTKVVGRDLKARLEQGVLRLQALHPYLDPLAAHFDRYATDASNCNSLLLSLVIYLASLALPTSDELTTLRTTLQPHIITLRDEILLTLPESFTALQCLDLLAVHAPLGVLPVQLANPRSLAVARGQIQAACHTSETLKFLTMLRHMRQVSRYKGAVGHQAVDEADYWLWISLVANTAGLVLEDESIKKPTHLQEAREYVDEYWGDDWHEIWSAGLHLFSPAQLIGRLSACDRVIRLTEVIDSALRIRGSLDAAATEPNYDLVGSTIEELKYLTERLDAIDARHDAIMGILSPMSQGIETGWLAWRSLRRRYEANKVYSVGLRAFMATAFLPGNPLAFSGLPEGMQPGSKIKYALGRATNPADIIPFIMATNNPATQATWTWGKHRGEICESTLVAFTEIGQSIAGGDGIGNVGMIVPLHDCLCIIVESAKIQMEHQAANIVMHRTAKALQSSQNLEVPAWVYVLRQVLEVVRHAASLSSASSGEGEGRESVASGCGNLLGSMTRLANGWTRDIRKEEGLGEAEETEAPSSSGIDQPFRQVTPGQIQHSFQPDFRVQHEPPQYPPPHVQQQQQQQQHVGGVMAVHAPTNGVPPEFAGEARIDQTQATGGGGGAGGGHGPYMDSSDRWMASDHNGPPPHNDPRQAQQNAGSASQGYGAPATPLDVLLSHMFNYSYQPTNQPQQAQQAQPTHSAHPSLSPHPPLASQQHLPSHSPRPPHSTQLPHQQGGHGHNGQQGPQGGYANGGGAHPQGHLQGHGSMHNQTQAPQAHHQQQSLEGCLDWSQNGGVAMPQQY